LRKRSHRLLGAASKTNFHRAVCLFAAMIRIVVDRFLIRAETGLCRENSNTGKLQKFPQAPVSLRAGSSACGNIFTEITLPSTKALAR
jgi:hypothetical protein